MSQYVTMSEIIDALNSVPGGTKVADTPFEIGGWLAAVAISGVNHGAEEVLDVLLTPGGTVRGRAGTTNGAPAGDPMEGMKFYSRPNGEKYYPRTWGELEDVEVVLKAREKGMAMFAFGAPGCGKTALFDAALPDLITIIGTGDTTAMDLIGQFVPSEEGGYRWVDGPVLVAAEKGLPLLIDEIGLIDTKELAVVYSLMDGRGEYNVTSNLARGTVKAAPGFFVVAATNPDAPGVRLSEAMTSRFPIHFQVTSDWMLLKNLGVPERIVRMAMHLDTEEGGGWAPQFRELLAYRDQEKVFGKEFALRNLVAAAPKMDRLTVANAIHQIVGEKVTVARI